MLQGSVRLLQLQKRAYFLDFGCKVEDQDKKWAPHVSCTMCLSKRNAWVIRKRRCLPFGMPVVWNVPRNHNTDCYFCMVPPIQNGMSMKKKINICVFEYTINKRPVPHGDGLSVPEPPSNFAIYSDDDDSVSSNS